MNDMGCSYQTTQWLPAFDYIPLFTAMIYRNLEHPSPPIAIWGSIYSGQLESMSSPLWLSSFGIK
jgi:hypothetical protein